MARRDDLNQAEIAGQAAGTKWAGGWFRSVWQDPSDSAIKASIKCYGNDAMLSSTFEREFVATVRTMRVGSVVFLK